MTLRAENVEAEIAVLGSMVLDPACIDRMRERLTGDMFHRPESRLMFAAICAAADRNGGRVDAVLLRDELRRRGKLLDAGGVAAIVEAMEGVPTSANADYYAKSVHDCYLLRAMEDHETAARTIREDPAASPAEKLAAIEADLRERVGDEIRTPVKPGGLAAALCELVENTIAGRRRRIGTPWATLDRLTLALLPETVTLLCGSPGASKSLMLLQAAAFWHESEIPFAVYELEQSREYHLMRAMAQRCNEAGLTDPDWIEANAADARAFTDRERAFVEAFGRCIHASPDTQPTLRQVATWVRRQARAGAKVIAVDPITAAAHERRESWAEDNGFMQDVKASATECNAAVILITHPTKVFGKPDLNILAGSAAFARFAQTALLLECHDEKRSCVGTECGSADMAHNRTVHILKARNGRGQGLRLAFDFEPANLRLNELGIIRARSNEE